MAEPLGLARQALPQPPLPRGLLALERQPLAELEGDAAQLGRALLRSAERRRGGERRAAALARRELAGELVALLLIIITTIIVITIIINL